MSVLRRRTRPTPTSSRARRSWRRSGTRQPDHPGIAHYLIHLYDTPALAEKGLTAARRYAKVAPDAPHALHMPSHIFTRVGYWQESIDSNAASARVAKADKEAADQLHAMDYEVYAYLQLGQDAQAKAVIDEMMDGAGFQRDLHGRALRPRGVTGTLRRGTRRLEGSGGAGGPAEPAALRHGDLVVRQGARRGAFGRHGAGRGGDRAAGRRCAIELREKKDAYWSEQVDIQAQVATAWLAIRDGPQGRGVEDDELTPRTPRTRPRNTRSRPDRWPRRRELYGAMLLEQGKAAEALTAFEATMRKEPNRLNAILGAADAAAAAGDNAKAGQYFAAAARQASDASADRADIKKARAFVAAAK